MKDIYAIPNDKTYVKNTNNFVAECLETCLKAYEESEVYAKGLLLDVAQDYFEVTLENTDWNTVYGLNSLGIYLENNSWKVKEQFRFLKSLQVKKIDIFADVKYMTLHSHFNTTDYMRVVINSDNFDLGDKKLMNIGSVMYDIDMEKYSEQFLPSLLTISSLNRYQNMINHNVKNIGKINVMTVSKSMEWIANVYAREPYLHNKLETVIEFNIIITDTSHLSLDISNLVNEIKLLTNSKKNDRIKTVLNIDPGHNYLKNYNILNLTQMDIYYLRVLSTYFDSLSFSGQTLDMYCYLASEESKKNRNRIYDNSTKKDIYWS